MVDRRRCAVRRLQLQKRENGTLEARCVGGIQKKPPFPVYTEKHKHRDGICGFYAMHSRQSLRALAKGNGWNLSRFAPKLCMAIV